MSRYFSLLQSIGRGILLRHSFLPYSSVSSSAALDSAYSLASNYLHEQKQICLLQISTLKEKLESHDLSLDDRLSLMEQHRQLCSDVQLKLDAKTAFDYKHGNRDFNIIRLSEMSNDTWLQLNGGYLSRAMMKKYSILSDKILPEDCELNVNLVVNYPRDDLSPKGTICNKPMTGADESVHVGRGNVILPHQTIQKPAVSFHLQHFFPIPGDCGMPLVRSVPKYASLLLIDCDFPHDQKLRQVLLWGTMNIPGQKYMAPLQKPLLTRPSSVQDGLVDIQNGTELFSYLPPHPQRGTSFHRYLYVLLGHEDPIDRLPVESSSSSTTLPSVYHGRLVHLTQILSSFHATVLGASWFLSIWTKAVSQIYRKSLNTTELAFGEPLSHNL